MRTSTPVLSGTSIIGDDVKNREGKSLGDIKDIMIDLDSGRIEYAVLSFGGFLGMGDKYFAVPFQALTVDTEKECLVLDIEKETLKEAPGFDKDNWPNFADPDLRSQLDSHYGTTTRRRAA
tara:strand:- start:3425 stop:3787 length:363 start_codon:yes stop_codon:yes gene_type:complete